MKVYSGRVCFAAILLFGNYHVNAQTDWSEVSDLSAFDRNNIIAVAEVVGFRNVAMVAEKSHVPSQKKFYVLRTEVATNGLRSAWSEMYVCRLDDELCTNRWKGMDINGWMIGSPPTQQERWRFSDGAFQIEVELGSAVSYVEAEAIIFSIYRHEMTAIPGLVDLLPAVDASHILSVHTIDPIGREYEVRLNNGSGSYALHVRFLQKEIELFNFIMSNA